MMIKIITDSASDLDKKIIKKLNIDVLEIKLADKNGNEIEYPLDSLKMFDMQDRGEVFKTSQISIYEYMQKFEECIKNKEEFICLTLSSGLSGGYQNAKFAEKELKQKYDAKFSVIDSKSASVGFGLIVYLAATAAKNNMSFNDLNLFVEFLVENIEHIFTVFDLKYLYEGGRLSRTTKTISSILNILPIIYVDSEYKLSIKEIIRGKNKVYKKMINIIKDRTNNRDISDDFIFPVYGRDMSQLDPFIDDLKDYGFKKIHPNRIGTTIASHIGPEIIGAGYLKNKIPENFKKYLEE